MKLRIADENREAENLIPPDQPDGSGIGVNYVGAYIKEMNTEVEGVNVTCKRKGLKILLAIGDDHSGEALLRRLENGPDVKVILRRALEDAAADAGYRFSVDDGVIYLEKDN